MDTLSSSSPSDDYTASRQADTIEAGSILISLANSHKPPPTTADKQELEAAAVAMESMSKYHQHQHSRRYSPEYSQQSTVTNNSVENEHYRRPPSSSSMSIHNLLSDDRYTTGRPESPPVRAVDQNRRRSSVEDQKAPVQYITSPPISHKRPLDAEDLSMPMKRSSFTKDSRDYSIPPRRYASAPMPVPHSNGRGMHTPTTVDDPYRSRNDHKFGTDAYHYDHMAQPSNNSQQRQPSHSSAHHQRKSSMSNLPQKYYAMKQSPKVKRNATHAYISYTIYMDITRRASIKNQLLADEAAANAHDSRHYYRPIQTSPKPSFDRSMYSNGQDRNRKQSQMFYNPSHAPTPHNENADYHRHSRRSSVNYPPQQYSATSPLPPPPPQPNERYTDSTDQHPAPPRYRPAPATESSYPPQELLAQPLTAFLRDRNNGMPR